MRRAGATCESNDPLSETRSLEVGASSVDEAPWASDMCPTQAVLARVWCQLGLGFGCELLLQVQIEDSRSFAYGVVVRIRGRGQPVDLIKVLQGLLAIVSLSHFQESLAKLRDHLWRKTLAYAHGV